MDEFSLSNPLNKDPSRQGRLVCLQKGDPRYVEGVCTQVNVIVTELRVDTCISDAALRGWLATSGEAVPLRPWSVQDTVP